eukprot:6948439-Prorocentrum_lima.AAC.1
MGYAGMDMKAQTGMFIACVGAPLLWRSSRQSVAILSTAEAELTAVALTWPVVAGIKELLHGWSVPLTTTGLLIDNSTA